MIKTIRKPILYSVTVILILVISWFSVSYFQQRNIENIIIGQLPHATAQQVLGYYFLGINSHSGKVVKASSYNKNTNFDYRYSDVKHWSVLDTQDVEPDTSYHLYKNGSVKYIKNLKVKFEVEKRKFSTDPSIETGTYTWTYILVKENDSSPWQVADWGV